MDCELIIRSTRSGVEIALLEDKRLVELHQENEESNFNVSDIFLGRVKRVNPGMNAAFVDVGHKRDAFLHYTDLGANVKSLVKFSNTAINGSGTHDLANFKFEPEIVKTGKINNAISKRHPLLVQILKEPISTKGPRLTCEISIPGRSMVLVPFGDGVGVSRKISTAEERKRLQRLAESIRPKNFGLVIRTAAEGKSVAQLHEELTGMVESWKTVVEKLKGQTAPHKILSEDNRVASLLRDIMNESFTKIVVGDKGLEHDVTTTLERIAPKKSKIVSLHSAKNSVFDAHGITHQIKSLFGKHVTMESGAYLVIEHTEAMHVIDVNSGQKVNNDVDQESNAFTVNMESAREIARQLRLRDIGGIIVVDFIDMKKPEHRKEVWNVLKDCMKTDRAKHTILPVSKFGLIQITRQRVRPELKITTAEECPSCEGTGKVQASILVIDDIKRNLEYLVKNQNHKQLVLHVHPFIHAYISKGFNSILRKWKKEYKLKLRAMASVDFHLLEFRFFDVNEEEIELK